MQAFETRRVLLEKKDRHIPDIDVGLKELTAAVDEAIPILGKNHKFVEEARKWQMRLHTQIQQHQIIKNAPN